MLERTVMTVAGSGPRTEAGAAEQEEV